MALGRRTLIVSDRAHRAHCAARAARLRAMPLTGFFAVAAAINDSDPLMAVYAAPEWQELDDDGRQWVTALVREAMATALEQLL